jgi:hypothetical protein
MRYKWTLLAMLCRFGWRAPFPVFGVARILLGIVPQRR